MSVSVPLSLIWTWAMRMDCRGDCYLHHSKRDLHNPSTGFGLGMVSHLDICDCRRCSNRFVGLAMGCKGCVAMQSPQVLLRCGEQPWVEADPDAAIWCAACCSEMASMYLQLRGVRLCHMRRRPSMLTGRTHSCTIEHYTPSARVCEHLRLPAVLLPCQQLELSRQP